MSEVNFCESCTALENSVTFIINISPLLLLHNYLGTIMKVLITGGTGTIGKQALLHALLRPEITSVVAPFKKRSPDRHLK